MGASTTSLVKDGIEPEGGRRCLEWCAKHRLIANSMDCLKCDVPMELRKRKCQDGFMWCCPNISCRTTRSVKSRSFFFNANLPLWKAVRLFHFWAMGTPLSTVARDLDIKERTIVDWFNFIREICTRYVNDTRIPIGGKDEYVEIDETMCFETPQIESDVLKSDVLSPSEVDADKVNLDSEIH